MLAEIIPLLAGMEQEEHAYHPRPSSAGPERCIRSMVYHGLNIPRSPMPGRARLILDDSSWHEELTADWLRKSPFKIHSQQMEITVTDPVTGITIKGSIDGIVTDMLETDRLLEHKALNHFTFQRFWGGEIPLDYVTQTCIYVKGAQALNPALNEAILLIKNKNTAQYMEYHILYKDDAAIIDSRTHSNGETAKMEEIVPDILRFAFDKFALVQDYIDRQTLPKRQYDIDTWRCEYCGWYEVCWKGYEKEFEELKTDTILPDEFADMVRYYRETGAQIKDMDKENKALYANIKKALDEINTREGRAGEYILRRKLIKSERIDKTLLTEAEKARATKVSISERLYISNYTKGENNVQSENIED
jgi:hypothetical protein